jgi:hypothetical protein
VEGWKDRKITGAAKRATERPRVRKSGASPAGKKGISLRCVRGEIKRMKVMGVLFREEKLEEEGGEIGGQTEGGGSER